MDRGINYLVGIILLLSFTTTAWGQRKWSQGTLTWNDFKGDHYTNDSTNSYLAYDLSYEYHKKEINDTSLIYFEAVASIDPNESTVSPNHGNESELKLNQIIFDIVEIHRRKLQVFLDSVEHPLMVDSLFPLYFDTLKTKIHEIQKQYANSSNKTVFLSESQVSTSKLLDYYVINGIPPFTANKNAFGIHLGLGLGIYNNNLNQYFTNPITLEIGGDLKIKKALIQVTGNVGWNTTKQEFDIEGEWPDDFSASAMSIESNIGYGIDLGKISITPIIGAKFYGIVSLTGTETTVGLRTIKQYNSYYTITPNLGVLLDYKLSRIVKIVPTTNLNSKKIQELDLRFKITANPIDFNNSLTTTAINTTIGISYSSRTIHLN